MLNKTINFLLFFVILFFISCEKEETASGDPTDSTDTVEEVDPCAVDPVYVSFQSEIDAASDGDTILVAPGTYEGNINFNGKNVVVASEYLTTGDSSYIRTTIIDAKQNGSVVRFENNETNQAALIGFTITGGYAVKGAGVYISGGAEPTLSNLRVLGNSTYICETDDYYDEAEGGGVYVNGGSPILEETTIRDNSSQEKGGGVFLKSSTASMRLITIYQNSSDELGGGIFMNSSSANIKHADISLNTSNKGGGIYLQSFSDISTNNSYFSGNIATEEGGGFYVNGSEIDFLNVVIYGNVSDDSEGGGGFLLNGGDVEFMNSIIAENSTSLKGISSGNIFQTDYTLVSGGNEVIEDEMSGTGTVDCGEGNFEGSTEWLEVSGNHFCLWEADRTFKGNLFTKSDAADKGNPDLQYNDIPVDSPDRWCLALQVDRAENPEAYGANIAERETFLETVSVRNDCGAYGGPEGAWIRNPR